MKFMGRQSVSGVTATVFGATGFMGRYVINRLGRVGSQVLIPYRGDGFNTRSMKLMGDLGQIQPMPIDLVEEESLHATVKNSNVVINLLGKDVPSRNYSLHDVNVKCVHRLTKAVAEAGVCKRFIHVSAMGADINSPCEFLRTKAEGEEVVKGFFPNATIIRPAPIFGQDSTLLDRSAQQIYRKYYVPVVDNYQAKIQPVNVHDVAQAVVNAIVSSDAPGKTYTAYGPKVYSRDRILDMVAEGMMMDDFMKIPIPKDALKLITPLIERFVPYESWRQWNTSNAEYESMDILPKTGLNLVDLGVTSTDMERDLSWCLMDWTGIRKDYFYPKPKRGHLNALEKQYIDSGLSTASPVNSPVTPAQI